MAGGGSISFEVVWVGSAVLKETIRDDVIAAAKNIVLKKACFIVFAMHTMNTRHNTCTNICNKYHCICACIAHIWCMHKCIKGVVCNLIVFFTSSCLLSTCRCSHSTPALCHYKCRVTVFASTTAALASASWQISFK